MNRQYPYPPGTIMLLVGTRRGLFLVTSQDRRRWCIEATRLETYPNRIFYATFDTRNHYRIYAADNGDFFGSFIRYSDDFGQTWREPRQGIQFPRGGPLSLQDIWIIQPGRPDEPEVLYAGTDPACLWMSEDGGETWEVNSALLSFPQREQWKAGAAGTSLHSIIADATHPSRMWVAISGGGCLRTDDGGASWRAINVLEDGTGEVGPGAHRLLHDPARTEVLYQVTRTGLYKSDNGGTSWRDIQYNLPSGFGFPLALDVHHPGSVFTIVVDPKTRRNIGEQFAVYRLLPEAECWETLTTGLPSGATIRLNVLRYGLCTDELQPCGVYVGTATGQLFASHNAGESWQLISSYLPPIYSVTAAIMR